MRRSVLICTIALLVCVQDVSGQPMDRENPVYYTIDRGVTLYHAADSARAYLHLQFREPVEVLDRGERWSRVRTLDGANGLVRSEAISNVWIRVRKRDQILLLYRGSTLVARFPTDLGYNFFADKERRGSAAEPDHWRTPEGEFFVVAKNPRSAFYKALVLNYPNAEDAERGKRDGLVSEAEYEEIVLAERKFAVPPMNTGLGGFIEIHGDGTGTRSNWTQGCIAVRNSQLDQLWSVVEIGTPVLIEP